MKTKIKEILSTISPELTTKLMFLYNFHRKLDLQNPVDFNEKIQYLKLKEYTGNPVVTRCVDKYQVRGYLEERGYADLLPELLGGPYVDPEEIRKDWDSFPDQFAVKCNHGSGSNIIVQNKADLDLDRVVDQLKKWIKQDYWKKYCEPQYRDVPKRVIVEQFLGPALPSFKFYCFNGVPQFVLYADYRDENCYTYFDMDFRVLPISKAGHCKSENVEKPKAFAEMVEISRDLSKDFPFVRVDFYNVNDKPYFSELTFVPQGGIIKLDPPSVIADWGNMLKL